MKKIIQKQLGELLIDSKMITSQQLDEALNIQKMSGELLGQILVNLGHTTEEAIALALTTQFGLPYLPLGGYEIDAEVARIIPESLARRFGLIAIDRVGTILTLAMSNPLNAKALEEVEDTTGLKVQIFVTTSTDVTQAIDRAYKSAG